MTLVECIDIEGERIFKDAFIKMAEKGLLEGRLSEHIWKNFGLIYDNLLDKNDMAG